MQKLGPREFRSIPLKMHYPDGDQIGNPRMIQRQTMYDFVVLTKESGVIRGLPIDGDQWNLLWLRCLEEGYQSKTRFAGW